MSLKSNSFVAAAEQPNRYVFSLFLNTDSDEADVTSLGRPFHTFAPATGKARPPIVDRRQVGTSSSSVEADVSLRRCGMSMTHVNVDTPHPPCHLVSIQGGPKSGPQTHDHNIISNFNRFQEKKITGRFLVNFVVKWILKIPPHLACVATLPCETLTSAKQAINNKLQGSVATYLRRGGDVNNQIGKFYRRCVCVSVVSGSFARWRRTALLPVSVVVAFSFQAAAMSSFLQ